MTTQVFGSTRGSIFLALLLLAACGGGGSNAPPSPPPTISAFAGTPAAITPGSTSTLAWTVAGATSLRVDPGIGSVSGTRVTVTPQATTTYTLTATNAGGAVTATATVRVGSAPVIASFAASPSWITTGGSAALAWSVSGATGVSIDALGSVNGSSVQVSPASDASYVLTASNEFGSAHAQATLSVFPPPKTWFAPFPPNLLPSYGAVDYLNLFSPTAPWTTAASHIQVFKLYPYTLSLPDADLKNLFSDLRRRHIAVGLEQGGLMRVDNGSCAGDFDGNNALAYVQRIRDLGGSLQYVALDEPVFSAVVSTDSNACHWSVQQTVDNVATTVAAMRSVFPDLVVGDIEPVAAGASNDTYLSTYLRWIDAWKATTGKPFAFFHFDVAWGNDWKPAVLALSSALRTRQIPVGQIYIGLPDVTTDRAWVVSTESEMVDFENHGGPAPDQVIFQSWNPLPHHVLPESDPSSFTYLIDRYFRDRTQMTLSASGGGAAGTVSGPSGSLAHTSITLSSLPLGGTGQSTAYSYSGAIPAATTYVLFGARVALEECSANPSPAEFYLTDFTFDAGASGSLHADFSNGLNDWGVGGNAALVQVEQGVLHVRALAGQTLTANSASLPFAAAGAAYTWTVNATIPAGSEGNGCVIAVFQDATLHELARATMQIVPQPAPLSTIQTDANGAYTFTLTPQTTPFELWADYAGSATQWPAAASTPIGQVQAVAIATASLPDGTTGIPYAQTLVAHGGIAPYLWLAGPLPPGFALSQDGILSGTPTAAGNYTLRLSVVDYAPTPRAAESLLQFVIH
jgi:hypothetical protein